MVDETRPDQKYWTKIYRAKFIGGDISEARLLGYGLRHTEQGDSYFGVFYVFLVGIYIYEASSFLTNERILHILEHVIWALPCFGRGGWGAIWIKSAVLRWESRANLWGRVMRTLYNLSDIGSGASGAGKEARGMRDERGMVTETGFRCRDEYMDG